MLYLFCYIYICIHCYVYIYAFIWGDANVNSIVLLISNSICSLLVYREVIDFYTLTLHLQPCYHQLLVSGFFVNSYRYPKHIIMWTKTILFLPLQSICLLVSLVLLHYLGLHVWCWKTKVGENILTFYLILVGKLQISHHYVWCELWVFARIFFIILRKFSSTSNLSGFTHKWVLIFQICLLHLSMCSCIFFFLAYSFDGLH